MATINESWETWEFNNWTVSIIPLFAAAILLGMELLSILVPIVFDGISENIATKGKHLDKLEPTDNLYITINKLLTIVFVYHIAWVCHNVPSIKWKLEELTIWNSLGSVILFYIFYDFFYMNFHRILHFRQFYGYVHKHHHRQKAPSRGNLDAINVHPFEFLVGEYLHLLTICTIPCHIFAVLYFILAAGILASLNHTRFDITIPYIFSVKLHDVHHRLPESNYAQYIVLWDYIFGSYRSYDDNMSASGESSDDIMGKVKAG